MSAIKFDHLIEELITNNLFIIKENGDIFAHRSMNGYMNKKFPLRNVTRKKSHGYVVVKYKNIHLLAHRIIYRNFKGSLNNLEVNHKDGHPDNNHIDNLELVTKSENLKHSYKFLNRQPNKGRAKINEVEAAKIKLLNENGMSYNQIAKKYNLGKSTIHYIVKNKTWTPK